jgi:hypothetical protein
VNAGFYETLAQVLPVLLLALIWDSAYLQRLRRQQRLPRRTHPGGVYFWTKPRVRVYTLAVTFIVLASIAVTCLVLADLVPDSLGLRVALSMGLVLALLTLFVRIAVDVIRATAPDQASTPTTATDPRVDDRELTAGDTTAD